MTCHVCGMANFQTRICMYIYACVCIYNNKTKFARCRVSLLIILNVHVKCAGRDRVSTAINYSVGKNGFKSGCGEEGGSSTE